MFVFMTFQTGLPPDIHGILNGGRRHHLRPKWRLPGTICQTGQEHHPHHSQQGGPDASRAIMGRLHDRPLLSPLSASTVSAVDLFRDRKNKYSLSPLLERSHVGHEIVEFLVIAFPLWVFALRELRFRVHHVSLEPFRVPVGADMAQIIRLLSSLPVNHVTRRAFVLLVHLFPRSRISRSCHTNAHQKSSKHSRHHSPCPNRP